MAAFGYVSGGPEAPRLGLNGLPGGRYRREMACERDHTLEAGPPSRILQLKSLTTVFFDPTDYLAADPAEAGSAREAERLRREAEQRAGLCEATTRLAAEKGLEATGSSRGSLRPPR